MPVKAIFSRDLEAFVLYYMMSVSVPSLHRESTDSLISHKKTFLKMKTYRDEIPEKQPNKVGTNDTTIPLRTPIPISSDIFPTRSYAFFL